MKKIAAIVLNYNTAEDTIKCTNYLMAQQNVDLSVVVVDNNSTDDSVMQLKEKLDSNVTLIKNETNSGYSAGNNIGLKKAIENQCEYALIINPDVEIVDKNALNKAIEILDKNERIGVLGVDIVDVKSDHQNPLRELKFWEDFLWPLATIKNRKTDHNRYLDDYMSSHSCDKVSGCCFFVRLKTMKEIDYLDENVFLYCEEPILTSRVKRKGYLVYYSNQIQVKHNHVEESKGDVVRRTNQFLTSRYYYLKNYKYRGIKKLLVCLSCKLEKRVIVSSKKRKKKGNSK